MPIVKIYKLGQIESFSINTSVPDVPVTEIGMALQNKVPCKKNIVYIDIQLDLKLWALATRKQAYNDHRTIFEGHTS